MGKLLVILWLMAASIVVCVVSAVGFGIVLIGHSHYIAGILVFLSAIGTVITVYISANIH